MSGKPILSAEQRRLDAILRETYGHGLTAPRVARVKPKRPCSRCGIATRSPDVCLDCQGMP